ncbi:hypothetical protein FH972_016137 [Carpinus fangiana]|uniref:Uncharacterized protein n=1 Tax=Carpinus fangiana TaxID=176857 RepID=A0A5N6REX6_9ROSI|nr:hypothetical protein FH972_016137 [Carpinus fangiana]
MLSSNIKGAANGFPLRIEVEKAIEMRIELNAGFLRNVFPKIECHHALLELHLEKGALVCPETARRFPVNQGIPNMLLLEDEIQNNCNYMHTTEIDIQNVKYPTYSFYHADEHHLDHWKITSLAISRSISSFYHFSWSGAV